MKIVIGLVTLCPGGAEFQASLLAAALVERGHEVLIYCMALTDGPQVVLPSSVPIRSVIRRAKSCRLHLLDIYWRWARWLRQDQPDAVVGFLPYPHLLLGCCAPLGTRIYGRRCFPWSENMQFPQYAWIAGWMQKVRRVTRYRTRMVVCNAEVVRRDVLGFEGWSEDQTTIIRNGWAEADQAPDNPRLVYAARNRVEKRHDELTQANRQHLDIEYSYERDPGWEKGGILLHASRSEGCSNAIGMAMAHGWPVVAFDCAGNRELINAGSSLVPLDRGMPALLRRAKFFHDLSPDYRQLCGGFLQDWVRQEFSLMTMVDRWEETLVR